MEVYELSINELFYVLSCQFVWRFIVPREQILINSVVKKLSISLKEINHMLNCCYPCCGLRTRLNIRKHFLLRTLIFFFQVLCCIKVAANLEKTVCFCLQCLSIANIMSEQMGNIWRLKPNDSPLKANENLCGSDPGRGFCFSKISECFLDTRNDSRPSRPAIEKATYSDHFWPLL